MFGVPVEFGDVDAAAGFAFWDVVVLYVVIYLFWGEVVLLGNLLDGVPVLDIAVKFAVEQVLEVFEAIVGPGADLDGLDVGLAEVVVDGAFGEAEKRGGFVDGDEAFLGFADFRDGCVEGRDDFFRGREVFAPDADGAGAQADDFNLSGVDAFVDGGAGYAEKVGCLGDGEVVLGFEVLTDALFGGVLFFMTGLLALTEVAVRAAAGVAAVT